MLCLWRFVCGISLFVVWVADSVVMWVVISDIMVVGLLLLVVCVLRLYGCLCCL